MLPFDRNAAEMSKPAVLKLRQQRSCSAQSISYLNSDPLMVMRGALDVSSGEAALAIGRAVPGARLREFEGSFPPVDDRARFAEEVLSFMDSVDGTVSRRAVMASGSMMPAGRL